MKGLTKAIYSAVKSKLGQSSDNAVRRLESDPDNPRYREELRSRLGQALLSDSDLVEELRGLLSEHSRFERTTGIAIRTGDENNVRL